MNSRVMISIYPCTVATNFVEERLYQIEHPRIVSQFDEVCDPETEREGFWISKAWLKGKFGVLHYTEKLIDNNCDRLACDKTQDAYSS